MPVQLRPGTQVFFLLWMMGWLVGRLSFHTAPTRSALIMADRPLIVTGGLRWLFGYKPTRGIVPFGGFFLQVAGFLTFACNLVLSLLLPQTDLSIAIGLITPFCAVFAYWLAEQIWRKQQRVA